MYRSVAGSLRRAMLGQAIVAGARTQPSKRVKSVQAVFARGVRADEPVEIVAGSLHEERNLGCIAVRFVQHDKVGAIMLVLMESPEADLVRLQVPTPPDVAPPDPARARTNPLAAPETIIVDDVDVADPTLVGPARLQLWVRFSGAPRGDQNVGRAVLSHATDGWLIGTAMRPHDGLGQSLAHASVSTGVISLSLSFHGDLDVTDWLLIDHATIFSGGGRTYGQGHVCTRHGELVASFVQEALLRHFPAGQDPTGSPRRSSESRAAQASPAWAGARSAEIIGDS
jgi:acyl-CoA thioesterase II